MMKKIGSILFFIFLAASLHAQDLEHLTKDLKCFDRVAYSALDWMLSTRDAGGYETMAEWSQKVSSNEIVRKKFPLEGGFQYVIILATESDVDATAIEIKDSRGQKLEYESRISDLDRNQINFFYTPPSNDIYQILFRTVNIKKSTTCMYMAIMKGGADVQEQ